jgi:hypothetical protein
VTLLRKLGPDFDPTVVGEIDAQLSAIAERETIVLGRWWNQTSAECIVFERLLGQFVLRAGF